MPSVSKGETKRFHPSAFILHPSLRFFMSRVLSATATKLLKLKPVGRSFLVLRRNVIAALALTTLKHDVVAWHLLISKCRLPIPNWIIGAISTLS